jgi:hypothetical protein
MMMTVADSDSDSDSDSQSGGDSDSDSDSEDSEDSSRSLLYKILQCKIIAGLISISRCILFDSFPVYGWMTPPYCALYVII